MARIPDELIAQLKREVDLRRVVEASGVELVRRGKDWVGLCPLHPDKEPSLFVNPDKGSWHCFGCDQGGSVIDWRMAAARLSFREAVESLMAEHLAGADVDPAPPVVPRLTDEELDELIGLSDAELRRWVAALYHGKAKDDPKPKDYLLSRGLTHPELIDAFHLGYADRTLGLMLPAKAWKRGAAIRERLTALGLLRESGHEHLAGRLIVPLVSLEGDLVQLYGRAVTPNLRSGTPDHLYLPGELDGVLNPCCFRDSDELILCEAPLDALTFWSAGFKNVTTSFGTNGFTAALHEALRLHGTRRLLIAYDRDDAGDTAARSLAARLLGEGIECYRVTFPKSMDANEYAQKVQPAEKSLDLVLRHAEWMGEGPGPSMLVPELTAPTLGEVAGEAHAPSPEAASFLAAASPPASARPAASLLPARPRVEVPAEVRGHEVVIPLGDRRYRVRGLEKNLSYDVLRVNLLANRGEGFHVDTLDLCSARQRAAFLKQVAIELAIEPDLAKKDLGKVLLKLEELQDEQIQTALAPKEPVVRISEPAREAAEAHLARPGLVERTVADLERAGLVGEETNKLVVYFAAVSRKLPDPLAVLIQSSSAAGKSALLSSTLALMPEEEVIAYSAMTGQSLFYMGGKDLQHKILAIAEEEGAERASYALKLLQSEGRLSIASTGKDPTTGRLLTHEYHVEGPAAILTTTTAIDLDEEFQNRCIVLTVDESREQTEAIHRFQRQLRTLEGLAAQEQRREVLELHRNAQRLIEPLRVVNPYALSLSYPSTCTRTRRDHMKYLGMIEAIALLHQRQREVKTLHRAGKEVRYVEATLEDVELANRLAHEVLGRTLDELPPQTQGLLEQIHRMVDVACRRLAVERRDYRFSRREIRETTGWGNTQLKMHLHRLEELEYLIVHHGRRGQSFVYELLYDGEAEQRERFLLGLLDVDRLRGFESDAKKSGSFEQKSGSSRGQVGPKSGGGRSGQPLVPATALAENGVLAPASAFGGHSNGASSHAKVRRSESTQPALVTIERESG